MPSIIHRFTPPTCTLEIIDRQSLIRWNTNKISSTTRFKLRFDDPRQATSRQVTVRGDRTDLLRLRLAIDNYVQDRLRSSFDVTNTKAVTQASTKEESTPYLKPLGLMHHELFFGSLTHDSDRPKLKLGTVQLFDLLSALEEYQTKIAARSNTEKPKRAKIWARVVATAVTIASIAAVANLLKPQPQQNIASDRDRSTSIPAVPELSEITPPATPESDRPSSSPKLSEPIASSKRLPPPPAVETPKPKPNIPDPADYPLSQVARQAGLDNSVQQDSEPQKPSQPQSAKTETEIIEKVAPEVAISPAIEQNRQEIESDRELNFQVEDTIRATEDLTMKNSAVQLSQTDEIVAYFENNWQPPEDLKQSLEYRLSIAPDGSVRRIIPLGKAARIYLDRTAIPIDGKPFISPISTDRIATIRVLLNPDGKVQAFEE